MFIESQIQPFDFTETKKVFDTSLYKNIPLKRRARVIANDLAGLVLEAGERSLEERINPWYVAIAPDGKIVNLVSREEVGKNFGDKNELARSEREGAIDFYYNKALNAKEGDLIFWFSPSKGNSPYTEARINVAKVRSLCGLKVLECYGIPSELPPDEILSLANYFRAMSEEPSICGADDLRKISILWPSIKNEDIWKIFQNTVQLDSNAWEAIAYGSPRKIKREAYKVALPIAAQMSKSLEKARIERDFVVIGAAAEIQMQRKGWKINKRQCEGFLNTDLLTNNITIDALGNFRRTSSKEHSWEWTDGDCVRCGETNTKVGPCKICRKCNDELDRHDVATS